MVAAKIRGWEKFPAHPLAEQYRDIPGADLECMAERMREKGFNQRHPILLVKWQGKTHILDGRQRRKAAIMAECEPAFQWVREPEESWAGIVDDANDKRRHLDEDERMAIAAKRRERVAASRVEGDSLRTIAEEEGVSQATVRRDLEEAESQGIPAKPAGGKVKGKDKKERPASSTAPGGRSSQTKRLCSRCERLGATKNCRACADLMDGKNGKPSAAPKPSRNGSVVVNRWKEFDSSWGSVVRQVDDMMRDLVDVKRDNRLQEIRDMFALAKKAFVEYHEESSKMRKAV